MAGVFQVACDYLPVVWPRVERMLKRDHTPLDLDRLHQRLLLGEVTLWLAVTLEPARCLACFTTCLVRNRAGRQTLLIHLMAGRRIVSWIQSALDCVGILAKRTSTIDHIKVHSRKGWKLYATRFAALAQELNVPIWIGRDRPTKRGRPRANRVNPEIGAVQHVSQ
jgi:hypothetical protein